MPPMYSSSGFNDNSRKEQRTNLNVNNHIYGGVGGHGGGAGVQGQGGSGGAGQGPILNYYIDAEEGNINHIHRHGEPGLQILQRATAGDSFHDSAERYPPPRCHPETRTEMLKDLMEWSSGDESHSSVLWLHGPAGAGKSAIAQSLCQQLEEEGRLGASFFFKRKHQSRGNAKKTLSYSRIPTRPGQHQTEPCYLAKNREKSIHSQQSSQRSTFVIVIDGLDECEGHDIQQEILRVIGAALNEGPLPLQFFITSRPEPHIYEMFTGVLKGIHRPLNIEQSFEDVWKYLVDEFARIHRAHRSTMAMAPRPWPSPEIIWKLVHKSSGYFIYASTVIKFIDDENFRPTERLQMIIGAKEPDSESPFAALDELYTQILSVVSDQPRLLKILAVIAAKIFLPVGSTDQLLDLDPGDVQLTLRGLQSVISLNKKGGLFWDPEVVVQHASFYEFLQDQTRAGRFYIGGESHLRDVCRHILKALSYKYDDPFLNRRGHVSRYLVREDAFKCIASSTPSLDLITLLRSFNPDFLFGGLDTKSTITTVLNWLKRSRRQPEDLIGLWEDYDFMDRCESLVLGFITGLTMPHPNPSNNGIHWLSQLPP
ncbi:hypothetical protein MVEN_00242300 [Mycena venus]|uniref:Nephrocystin 3-like N-terminal domain-containing protein n=1 Tax=Mycena venus TaxID=2733690 RepID=A0A8H6Z2F9_9AGAR|nr:hypothetical protein MVEN_00242300 [Mycena venus]